MNEKIGYKEMIGNIIKQHNRMEFERLMNDIHPSWMEFMDNNKELLEKVMTKMGEYPKELIYPSNENIFRVFRMGINEIRVVLLGQDPYHGPGQANGLSFSVNNGIRIPPSLKNIYKELNSEYEERNYEYTHGDLTRWFEIEKIFLLNSSLTVLDGKAGIFMKDWEKFTDKVIEKIQKDNERCIFLLMGNFSIKKMDLIENKDRCVTCVHPSPLSANRGFFGSGVFREVEDKLGENIDWSI